MKKLINFSLVISICMLAGLFISGCASTKEAPVTTSTEKTSKYAEPKEQAAKMLDAFLKDKPDALVALLPEDMRKEFGKNEFTAARNEIVQTLGEIKSYKFVTRLEHPVVYTSVWLVDFERTSSEGEKIKFQSLFRASFGQIEGKWQILSFNFL